jgi:hypothetical protein
LWHEKNICNSILGRKEKRQTEKMERREKKKETIGCFKKSFTTLKEYTNLYTGHTQRFELS